MQAVLNAALPIFALILVGFGAGRNGLLDRVATDNLNRFAVYLALPALIFSAMAKVTPQQIAQGGFAASYAGGVAVAFAVAFAFARHRGRRVAEAGVEGLDASYANVGFMGVPLCLLLFGEASLPAVIVTMLLTATVLFLFAVVVIESDVKRGGSLGQTTGRLLASLGRSPLLIAPVLGFAVALSGFSLPDPVERFATLLGSAASPVALVCIGLFLAQERVGGQAGPVAALVALKLLVQPAVTACLVLFVFDVPPLWAKVAILGSALPIGTGPFTLATLYRLDARVTSGAILASHAGSVLTVSCLVAWLG